MKKRLYILSGVIIGGCLGIYLIVYLGDYYKNQPANSFDSFIQEHNRKGTNIDAKLGDIKILDSGSLNDRILLRYNFDHKVGEKTFSQNMKIDMSQDMTKGSRNESIQSLISMKMDLIEKIYPGSNDSLSTEFGYKNLHITVSNDDKDLQKQMQDGMDGLEKAMGGLRYDLTYDNTGKVLGMNSIFDGNMDQYKQYLQSFESSLKQLSIQLPNREIGTGGVWTVLQEINSQGLQIFQENKYTINKIDGNNVFLDVITTQVTPEQTLQGLQVKAVTNTTKGTTVIRLDSIIPIDSQIQGKNVSIMEGPDFSMKISVDMSVFSKENK